MPIPGVIYSGVLGSFPSKGGISVTNQSRIASGVELGVSSWLYKEGLVVSPSSVGTLGGGSTLGSFSVFPNVALVSAGLSSAGVFGVMQSQLSTAVGLGVAGEYLLSGSCAGVGVGVFIGGVFGGTEFSLEADLLKGFGSVGIVGVESLKIAKGLSLGICGMFRLGLAKGVVAGAPSIIPSAGVSQSKFL